MKNIIKNQRVPLKIALLLPMVILIFFIVGASIVQFQNYNSKISDNISSKISDYIQNDIEYHLEDYLGQMKKTLILNVSLAENKLINLEDENVLGRYLLDEVKVNGAIDFSYYANELGGIVSSGILDDNYRISYTNAMTLGRFDVYDANSNELKLIKEIEGFDPRVKEWYTEVNEDDVYWTDIYYGVQNPVLGISASKSYYDNNGKKNGVFGADFLLNELSVFLENSKMTDDSLHVLIESNGDIIGLSNNDKPFYEKDGKEVRLSVNRYANEYLIDAYEYIYSYADEFEDKSYLYNNSYINISKFELDNVEWFIISVIPRSDILIGISELDDDYYVFMILIIIISILVIRKMILLSLSSLIVITEKLNDIGNGQFGGALANEGDDIVGKLIKAFNQMSRRTIEYESKLEKQNKELIGLNETLESQVRERTKELTYISITDGLTGLKNHREALRKLEECIINYEKNNNPFSVIMLDVDNFKNVNDKYGHTIGDKVLKSIANSLIKICGVKHFAGRYGGEEFIIISETKNLREAVNLAEAIRIEVSSLDYTAIGIEEKITISSGVSHYKSELDSSVIDEADKMLYRAKDNGRNRVEY